MLETFKQLGLADLAESVASILRLSNATLDDDAVSDIVDTADSAIHDLEFRGACDPGCKFVVERQRDAILCGLKVLADELRMGHSARAILDDYLHADSRAVPERLVSCLPNGCAVECRMTDYVGLMTWLHGVYEPLESFVFSHLVGPEMVVVDAGANLGQYTLLAATAVGPHGSVHSFEPYSANFASLVKNVTRNNLKQRCHLNAAALWSDECALRLSPPSRSLVRSYATNDGAYQVLAAAPASSLSREITMAARLDDYASAMALQRLDIVKIDVEGAEPRVLEGAMKALATWHPLVLIEINKDALSGHGYTSDVIFDRMAELGYNNTVLSGPLDGIKHCNCLFYTGRPQRFSPVRIWFKKLTGGP